MPSAPHLHYDLIWTQSLAPLLDSDILPLIVKTISDLWNDLRTTLQHSRSLGLLQVMLTGGVIRPAAVVHVRRACLDAYMEAAWIDGTSPDSGKPA